MTSLSRRAALPALLFSCALAAAGCPDLDEPLPPTTPPTKVTPEPPQQTTIAAIRPPPISGGTLLVTRDGAYAYAADSDRDRVVEVAIGSGVPKVARELKLTAGDEPGRIVEDDAHRLHVVSRSTGAIVSIDRQSGAVDGRRWACPAPRGLAYDASRDVLVVACVGGEIVTLSTDPTDVAMETIRTESDLRDVSIQGDRMFVTRFRSAELLVLALDGTPISRTAPLEMQDPITKQKLAPSVAWRALPLPGGGLLQVHQRAMASVLPQPSGDIPPAYYGPSCHDAIVQSSVTLYDAEGNVFSQPGGGRLANTVLPVDAAITPDGTRLAILSAATNLVTDAPAASFRSTDWCGQGAPVGARSAQIPGEPIALSYDAGGRLYIQSREPSALWMLEVGQNVPIQVPLGGRSVADTGHELFHGNPDGAATISCASCHPEGRDDGRVYVFSDHGPRRTISLAGGILQTAPFHWEGDLAGMGDLMDEIFVARMGGKVQNASRLSAIATYVDQLPAVPGSPEVDHDAALRGRALFEDTTVGCTDCHEGPRLTNNATVDVGTGGKFQVPSLQGLAHAGPFMHNGCAPTLRDRFTAPCGGGEAHGHTAQLGESQLTDLVAYLETL